MIKIVVEPVFGQDKKMKEVKKTIRIAGLKVYEKTCKPVYRGDDWDYTLFYSI
jgi:hypothetical protein